MINYIKGDIFTSTDNYITNPVNCVGVMGAGLAKLFKQKYSDEPMFYSYRIMCQTGKLNINSITYYLSKDKHNIIFFPTKNHWKEKSNLLQLENNLKNLDEFCLKNKIYSLSLPMLGCGLGGLQVESVKSLFKKILSNSKIKYNIYEF